MTTYRFVSGVVYNLGNTIQLLLDVRVLKLNALERGLSPGVSECVNM